MFTLVLLPACDAKKSKIRKTRYARAHASTSRCSLFVVDASLVSLFPTSGIKISLLLWDGGAPSNVLFWVTLIILKIAQKFALQMKSETGKGSPRWCPSCLPVSTRHGRGHKTTEFLWLDCLCDISRISPLGMLPPRRASSALLSGSVIGEQMKSRLEMRVALCRAGREAVEGPTSQTFQEYLGFWDEPKGRGGG